MPTTNAPLQIAVTWRLVRLLERVAAHVAAAEGFRTGRLSVAVIGTRAMTTLHQRFLGVAQPTDVLSFDLGTNRKQGKLDGEIVLCADAALRRARDRAKRPENAARRNPLAAARAELALYLTHGILHLAGYDDHAPADYHRMHAREDELLCELGLGPVFSG